MGGYFSVGVYTLLLRATRIYIVVISVFDWQTQDPQLEAWLWHFWIENPIFIVVILHTSAAVQIFVKNIRMKF